MWAVIGGSGFEKFDAMKPLGELDTSTPFGNASSGMKRAEINGVKFIFISRHGKDHELLPTEVNYRANIFALKKYGATKILAFSAVGSLQKDLPPGDLVVPNQYIDRTKTRQNSYLGNGIVGHVSLAKPVSTQLVNLVNELAPNLSHKVHFNKTLVCIEGPYFSTQAESNSYRAMGANIIGMTSFPEYALAREAGISYLPCCFVTDYDCWDDAIPHVTLPEIIACMKANNRKAFVLAEKLLPNDLNGNISDQGLKTALLTPWDSIPAEKKAWLEVLIK